MTTPPSDPRADIERFAEILFAEARAGGEGQPVFELRVVDWHRDPGFKSGGTNAGYFDDPKKLAQAAAALDARGARAVYVTLSPVNSALLARATNRVEPRSKHTTADADIVRRLWILVDVDPKRPAGISSSDAEHEAALAKVREIREELRRRGWPDPLVGDSGNGGHLLYRIDLPNDEASTQLVLQVLRSLAARFDDGAVVVDTSVHNAARISKVYGTTVRKGDSTPERPHRVSRLLEVPVSFTPVPVELLSELAEEAPREVTRRPTRPDRSGGGKPFDLDTFIQRHGLQIASTKSGGRGEEVFVLQACPFNADHTGDGGGGGSAAITRERDGRVGFKCHHNGCAGKGWHELRELLEPGCYDREAGGSARKSREELVQAAEARAAQEGLLPFDLVEAYRRAAHRGYRPGPGGEESTSCADMARALAGVPGTDEDVVVRILHGDEEELRAAFRQGGVNLPGMLPPPAVGAGALWDVNGVLIPVTWECTRRGSADTGTLRTPLFSDRLSLENSSRRTSAAKKIAKAHGLDVTDELLDRLDKMLMAFSTLDADTRAEARGGDQDGDAEALVAHLKELGVDFFHTPGGLDAECFAVVQVGGHREVWNLGSRGFKCWLRRINHDRFGRVLSDTLLQSVVGLLSGFAMFDGPEHEVFVRRAGANGKIYFDLGHEDWSAIEVDKDGWRVVDPIACGVHFIRKSGMLPLPMPVAGGRIDELRVVLNVADEESWTITKGFLLSALHPTGPYLGLVVHGEQGSGKSGYSKTARRTVDPSNRDVRRGITNEPDLAIAASSSLIVAVDNLSNLSAHLSDAFCSLATGASLTKRTLYTDADETCIVFKRPVILNGINNVATRADLADRMIPIHLSAISKKGRRSERWLEAKFQEVHPRVLGALLTAASAALRRRDEIKLDEAERMVDILEWVTAAEPELGIEPGGFGRAYAMKVQSAAREALDASLVGAAVLELMQGNRSRGLLEWRGTCKALDHSLRQDWESGKPPKGWPANPTGVAHALRRAAPLLRRESVEVIEPGEKDRPRNYTLRIEPEPAPDDRSQGGPLGADTPVVVSDAPAVGEPSGENGPGDPEKACPDGSDTSDTSRGHFGLSREVCPSAEVGGADLAGSTPSGRERPGGAAEHPQGPSDTHRDEGLKWRPETVGSVGSVGTPSGDPRKADSDPSLLGLGSSEPSAETVGGGPGHHQRPTTAGAPAPAARRGIDRPDHSGEEDEEWSR